MVPFRCPLRIRIKGGPGSGHRGHRGRPGLHGGSLPGVGGARNVTADWSDVPDEDFRIVFGDKLTRESVEDMFTLSGATLKLNAEVTGLNTVSISGEWRTSTGKRVGYTVRIFARDAEGKHAYNESLQFEAEYRGRGLATSLYDRQEAQLRKAGFKDIQLYANITIGRYAWARRGYDYAHPGQTQSATTRFEAWAKDKGISEPIGGWPTFKSAADVANYKIPGVSMLGKSIYNTDVPKDMEMHVGKAFMLDKRLRGHGAWGAVKELQG